MRNEVINSALRGLDQANLDLRVFQETKVPDGIYTRVLAGYRIFVTASLICHQGVFGCLLQGRSPFSGRDATASQAKHPEFTGGFRRVALVLYQVPPGPLRHGYHQTRSCDHRPAPQRIGAASSRVLQHQSGAARGEHPRRRDRGGYCDLRARRSFYALPPAPQIMSAGREDVDHSPSRERGAVLDGLPSGNGPPSVPECLCPLPWHNSDQFIVFGCRRSAAQQEQYCYLGSLQRVPFCPPRQPFQ